MVSLQNDEEAGDDSDDEVTASMCIEVKAKE